MDQNDKLATLVQLIIGSGDDESEFAELATEQMILNTEPVPAAAPTEAPSSGPNPGAKKKRLSDYERSLSFRQRVVAAKRARDTGAAYTSFTGKRMPPRQMRPACLPSCRLRCTERVTETERAGIFREFWDIADHTGQWDYIAHNINVAPKEKCTIVGDETRRAYTRMYFFHYKEKIEQVCKPMFLNTLGISNAWVGTVCKKLADNGYVSADGRGKVHRKKAYEPV